MFYISIVYKISKFENIIKVKNFLKVVEFCIKLI